MGKYAQMVIDCVVFACCMDSFLGIYSKLTLALAISDFPIQAQNAFFDDVWGSYESSKS
jgi:hypothetical protein